MAIASTELQTSFDQTNAATGASSAAATGPTSFKERAARVLQSLQNVSPADERDAANALSDPEVKAAFLAVLDDGDGDGVGVEESAPAPSPSDAATTAANAPVANGPVANAPVANAPEPAAVSAPTPSVPTDEAIEGLGLSAGAKAAAYELKKQFPSVVFTSGLRDKDEQASAMASNVVHNRLWIDQTYVDTVASRACQKWVTDHPEAKTQAQIAAGLRETLDGLSDDELNALSYHLSGDAFDVQPVAEDAEKIKAAINELPGLHKFLDKEGGRVVWHAQFAR
jgi:hypothetical protein